MVLFYISLLFSLVLLFLGFFTLFCVLMGITLCACMGLWGIKSFTALAAATAVSVFFVSGMSAHTTIIACLCVIPAAFLIGLGLNKNKTIAWTIVPAALTETIVFGWIVYDRMKDTGASAVAVLFGSGLQSLANMRRFFTNEKSYNEFLKALYVEIDIILPAVLIISAGVLSLFVYLISSEYLRKKGKNLAGLPSFSQLYLSRGFTGIYFIILIITWFSSHGAVLQNVYLVVSGMFVFCGFSLCSYWLSKLGIPKMFRAAIISAAIPLSLFLVFPITVFNLLGLIDSTRNFRKLKFEGGRLVNK